MTDITQMYPNPIATISNIEEAKSFTADCQKAAYAMGYMAVPMKLFGIEENILVLAGKNPYQYIKMQIDFMSRTTDVEFLRYASYAKHKLDADDVTLMKWYTAEAADNIVFPYINGLKNYYRDLVNMFPQEAISKGYDKIDWDGINFVVNPDGYIGKAS
jgi:hypothetical protein